MSSIKPERSCLFLKFDRLRLWWRAIILSGADQLHCFKKIFASIMPGRSHARKFNKFQHRSKMWMWKFLVNVGRKYTKPTWVGYLYFKKKCVHSCEGKAANRNHTSKCPSKCRNGALLQHFKPLRRLFVIGNITLQNMKKTFIKSIVLRLAKNSFSKFIHRNL